MAETESIKKPPIIFVHGAWHGGWCWDQWIKIFHGADFTNTVAVELRGHGYKVGSFQRARLENYVQDVEVVLEKIGEKPILIGHSLGCSVIKHLKEQDRFRAVVFVAPVPAAQLFRKVFIQQILRHPILAFKSLFTRTMQPWVSSRNSTSLFFSKHVPTEIATKYVDRMQGESFRLFALDLLRDTAVKELEAPTLVVAAGEDKFFSQSIQRKTAKQLNAQLITAERSGHDVMLDCESVEVAARTIDWLESLPHKIK